ncbi:hypothetical protein FDUTEX481_01599 [Tolypothrix sp. PCC 7601]|nr:hypothetical protein FDUTEX481_01599 [Tolypothrix sp. PCC 7601]
MRVRSHQFTILLFGGECDRSDSQFCCLGENAIAAIHNFAMK